MPRTRHTISGVIDENTPEHIVTHPVLGKYLEVVDEDAKPFLPAMHKPTVAKPKDADEAANPEKNGKDR